jgi:hypothetical protein
MRALEPTRARVSREPSISHQDPCALFVSARRTRHAFAFVGLAPDDSRTWGSEHLRHGFWKVGARVRDGGGVGQSQYARPDFVVGAARRGGPWDGA